MSWYSVGAEAAEQLAASQRQSRRNRSFFTKPGEAAVIRFLAPASTSFNYKRAFVKWAKGQKLLTSPQTNPDPFVEAGLSLQAASAWWIIDRRKFEFDDKTTGEKKEVGPRIQFFADGMRTRKTLLAFEQQMLEDENEARAEDGKDPLTLEEFNLTSYDITVKKEKGAAWLFTAKRPKPLAKADLELVEKAGLSLDDYDVQREKLAEELAPRPTAEIVALLGGQVNEETPEEEDSSTPYSYEDGDDNEDTIKFDD